MRIHCVSYYDEPDATELVDIEYQCSAMCNDEVLLSLGIRTADIAGTHNFPDGGSASWGYCGSGDETEYDVFCSHCEEHLWHGLSCDCDDRDE